MYKKTTLPNDLRVVTHDMKDRDSVALGFWLGVGGRHENDSVKGISHFIEHIGFKGSQKYSCNEIKELIEGVGGSLNAFTGEEQTCYYAKIPSKHVNRTFDVLADMLLTPLMKDDDIAKEKAVILEEIKMYHDLPQYYVMEMLDELMWPNHPLGKSLAGTAQTVSALSRKTLVDFHQKHYSGNNFVISACGDITHQRILDLVKKKFKRLDPGVKNKYVSANDKQAKPQVKIQRREIEQMHVALGTFALDSNNEDRYAQNLLNIILGGNMSSRLFNEVRENRGLAYSISSSVKSLQDTGMFMVRAGVDNHKLVDAIQVILDELGKIKRTGVTADEFKRAKEYYLGQVLLGLEDTLDHMFWIGESMLTRGEFRTLKDIIQRVNKVRLPDIQRVAKQILQEKQYNLAVVGPMEDAQEKKLREILGA